MLTITAEDDLQRLDRFLRNHCPEVTLARINACIREGEVRINGSRSPASARLKAGDQLRLPPLLRHHWQENRQKPVAPPTHFFEDPVVIYEDTHIVVVNKPAGMACHGGSGVSFGLIESLRRFYQSEKMELVHRLDRETSGAVLIARSRLALRPLHEQFREGKVSKEYRAIVHGIWPNKLVDINLPLHKWEDDHRVHKVVVSARGKPSHTEVHRIATRLKSNATMSHLRLIPHTGRTHQLRVHLAHQGHPIVGDQRYADFERDHALKQQEQFKARRVDRMFLHAYRLAFIHPITEEPMVMLATLPMAFDLVLADFTAVETPSHVD